MNGNAGMDEGKNVGDGSGGSEGTRTNQCLLLVLCFKVDQKILTNRYYRDMEGGGLS